MSDRVKVTVSEHIAEVALCRPEKMNALDQASFNQLAAAAKRVASDSSVRVVIIHAEGDHFCSGADKLFLQSAASDKSGFQERVLHFPEGEMTNEFQKPTIAWFELDVPVVICLQGAVYGAGLQLALAGDIRIASSTTAMSVFEIHWGLIPDMGITLTLPRLVRADIGLELVVSGRVVNAQEALQIGLITRLAECPLDEARKTARLIASKSPDATQRGKRLMRDSANMDCAQALLFEARLQSELIGTPNQLEAAMANLEKRDARFSKA